MDLGATIVGMTIILMCIIPFVLISRNNRKQEQKLLEELVSDAEKHHCNISRHDFRRNSVIGIDDNARMAFFAGKVKNEQVRQHIRLAEIQKCRVINSGRIVHHSGSNHKVIEKIEMAFTFQNKNQPEALLEFYNRDYDSPTLTGELQLAEKWCKIFNDKISVTAA